MRGGDEKEAAQVRNDTAIIDDTAENSYFIFTDFQFDLISNFASVFAPIFNSTYSVYIHSYGVAATIYPAARMVARTRGSFTSTP